MNHFEGNLTNKLPNIGTTIFSVMSALANKHKAINLSQGFPDFDCDPKLVDLVSKHMKAGKNQYAPMPGIPELRNAIAEKTKLLYGAEYNPETEITVVAGATQAIEVAISTFVSENDEVVLFDPAYDSYAPCISINKGIPVHYTMEAPNYKIDWKQVVKLINQHTKMIIINTPHNPTGTILNEDDMVKLQRMLAGSDIIVLSDEVYEHIVFDEAQHESPAKFKDLKNRTLCVSSFGKTYHTTGWKIGYVLAPENLSKEFRKVYQYSMFSVSTPMQYAFAEMLQDASHYLELAAFYQKKRNLFKSAIEHSKFKILGCSGTYFQCVDYSQISDKNDMEFTQWLAKEVGVAAIPLSPFYRNKDDNHIIRFCFAKEDETLNKSAELLCRI